MTFNIRYGDAEDGVNHWRHRRPFAIEVMREHDPDLLGLQEPNRRQWDECVADLGPGWRPLVPEAGGDPAFDPFVQGGLVRISRFEPVASGCFWLSDTPRVPRSISFPHDWNARFCAWTRLRDREAGRDLVFSPTHLDTNQGSWLPAARVLAAELDAAAGGLPVVLVGDFNCAAGSEAHRFLTREAGFRDAWNEAGLADEGVTTFNAFTKVDRLQLENLPEAWKWLHDQCDPVAAFAHYPAHVMEHRNYRIDWILVRGPLKAVAARVDTRHRDPLLPSDHYPVISDLAWTE